MPKKTDNNENFRRYQERLEELKKEGELVPSPDLPLEKLIPILIAEGNKLLEAEAAIGKLKKDHKKMTSPPPVTSDNPYLRARVKILNGYPDWKKREIAEMERTGNIHNRIYEDFVTEVNRLGGTL